MALGFGLALTSYRKAAAAGAVTDPYFSYVPLLLNTTSTNAQQNNTFLDSSSNNFTITRNGTPTQGSFTPYLPNGYWSNYASSNNYLTVPNSTPLELGSGNFTIECWINGATQTGYGGIVTKGGVTNIGRWTVAMSSSGTTAEFWVNEISLAGPIAASSTLVNDNKWHHIAVVRASNVFTFYVDGIAGTTTTTSSTAISALNEVVAIGTDFYSSSSRYYTGYISNVRIVKGVAVYTGNFTPPTTPLAATQSAGTNISAITGTATSLLTSQSNRFIDNSTNAISITVNGTPQVQASQPFAPAASYSAATYGGSGYFNGSSSSLSTPSSTEFAFGTGDFTMECWFYLKVTPTSGFTQLISGGGDINNIGFGISGNPVPLVYYDGSGAGGVRTLLNTPNINTWYHVAVARQSGTTRGFINGALVGAWSDTSNVTTARQFFIGSNVSITNTFNGYLSNDRIVKGTAVYTAAFTPPTLPVTAVSGTSLLINYGNAGIYDAAWQNDVTTVGDAQVSTTQKQWGTTSMKFDGTGDWLTLRNNPAFAFGTGDFTLECWVYFTSVANFPTITDSRSSSASTAGFNLGLSSAKVQLYTTSQLLIGGTTLAINQWYYIAVTRAGTALKIFVNGSQDATTSNSTNWSDQTLIIGVTPDLVNPMTGYIQDLRLTKGVARTITTPTAAFPTR